jgi:hypothetical protein
VVYLMFDRIRLAFTPGHKEHWVSVEQHGD